MIVHVMIYGGQSNASGAIGGTVPAGIPDASIRFWNHTSFFNPEEIDFGEFRDLDCRDVDDNHGGELAMGLALKAAGLHAAFIKIASGATTMFNWTLASSHGPTFQATLAAALAALPAELPSSVFRFYLVWNQGENDSANDTNATLWGSRFATFVGQVEDTLAAAGYAQGLSGGAIVRTSIHWDSASEPAITSLRTSQAEAAAAFGFTLIDQDDFAQPDHITAAQQNTLGARQAAALLEIINMGTLSTYQRTALVNHFRNKGDHTPAATHYCAAFVAGVEVSGNSYARSSNTNNKTTWSDAASRAITNDVAFTFPDATGAWGEIDEVRIYDHATAGNELARHTLDTPIEIDDTTGPLVIDVGAIDITCAAGGLTDTVVHELMNLAFGATANSPRATTYGTYFAGDPDAAGSETSATRTAVTQATAWGAAANGLAKTVAAVALADEGDATYWCEFTASSAGTRLTKALLPALPSGGVIPAGALRTSFS